MTAIVDACGENATRLCARCEFAFHTLLEDATEGCGCLRYGCGCRANREPKEAA